MCWKGRILPLTTPLEFVDLLKCNDTILERGMSTLLFPAWHIPKGGFSVDKWSVYNGILSIGHYKKYVTQVC